MNRLNGKTAVITGGATRIGRATAEGLARAGGSVVINGHGNARVDEAVRQMQQPFHESDISDVAAVLSTAKGAEAFIAQARDVKVLHPVNRRPRAWPRSTVLNNVSKIYPVGEALSRVASLTFDYLVNYYAAMGRISNAKEQLMAAATELTWQKGYNGVTVDDICERAGVRKGSFYYFFKSKAALSVAAMDNWWQTQTRPNLDSVFSASHPPLDRIKAYFEMIHQHYLDQKNTGGRMLGCPFFSLAMEGGGLEPEVLHASQQYVKRKRKYLEAAIRDAQAEGVIKISSVEEAAQGLQALVEGAVALSRVQNDLEPLRSVYKEALRLLGATQPVAMA